jgi:hypothetical protein
MWHVSSFGTHLNTERETFIRDTGAFITWIEYHAKDPDMFGYAIEVTGRDGQLVTATSLRSAITTPTPNTSGKPR